MSRDDATWRRAARLARGALPLRTGPWAAAGPHGAGPDEDADATSDRPARAGRGIDEVIGDCALYEDGRRRPGRIDLEDAGRTARSVQGGKGFVWIGLQQPTAEEIAVVADAFGLPALAVEDAVKAHQRPKLEVYGDVVFVVIKPVRYVDHEEVVDVTEIAVFLGRNFVVTVRHGNSDVLRTVRAEIDDEGSRLAAHGPTGVLYRTADLVVDGYEEAISSIDVDVDEIELQVFGAEQHDVDDDENSERIYKLKREIAEFRRAVGPLALPVQRLADGAVAGVDAELLQYFRDVHDHVLRAADAIEVHDRLLSDVLQAELARVAARQSRIAVRQNEIAVRQNEDMRKISAWAAIALVPTAIAGIYGMNFENMPELETQYGYFVVLGVITSACATLYLLFRRNGWL